MDAAYTAMHIEQDREHWWFRGRLRVLLAVLRATLPRRPLRLLELGCGTGNVLASLREFGEAIGVERGSELITAARERGLDVRAGSVPDDLVVPPGWADVVLLLDVVEHVDNDVGALRGARGALRPGGWLVVTVPAYPWLWGGHDVALGHRRRYTASRLRHTVEAAGFSVERTTYFNTFLFPALVVRRGWKRLRGDTSHDLDRPPRRLNRWLDRIFALERHVVARWTLPFGASLLVVARR